MDRRADVVTESGESELFGPGSPTDPIRCLYNEDPATGPGQLDGGGEAVGPGADDGGVVLADVSTDLRFR